MGKTCVLGGTFTYVHAGHERLLLQCRRFARVLIGLTSDSYVRRRKLYPSFPYPRRLAGLQASLEKLGISERARIFKIDEESGGADRMSGVDAIIGSEETRGAAERINMARKRRGLPPLEIISVPLAYGQGLKKISCADIYEGKTDLAGNLLKPLWVQAGTDNPTKLKGAKRALRRIFGTRLSLRGHKESSKVEDHPFNSETFEGAKNRAHAAWRRARGKCDYSIGMESGLFALRKGLHIDITVCCAYDGREETYGTGMGFVVPEEIARRIRREKSDLSRVLAEISGVRGIGRKHGAIGHFSAGVLHRSEQVEQSVLCAFVPRLAKAKVAP